MSKGKNSLKIILAVLIILVVADGILTNMLIQKGIASEANPFLVNIAGNHGLLVIKSLGVMVAVVILWDIYRRSPRLSLWASSVFLAIYTGIVVWNLHLLLVGVAS